MLERIEAIFREKPEAFYFLNTYYAYIHSADDLIDEEFKSKEDFIEKLSKTHYLASIVFSCDYFIRNRNRLLDTWHAILNTYTDSAKWERSSEEKKKVAANTLRHTGQEMIMLVLKIEFGWDALRAMSEIIRTDNLT